MDGSAAYLKLDLKSGQVEVSGSEDFVKGMVPDIREWVEDYAERFIWSGHEDDVEDDNSATSAFETPAPPVATAPVASAVEDRPKTSSKPKTASRARRTATLTPIPVNLKGGGSIPSLREFVAKKLTQKPNQQEIVTVLTYYLIKHGGLDLVTPGHILTCYNELGYRKPAEPDAIFRNIKQRGGWVQGGKAGYSMTFVGENYVEHDLPS